MVPKNQRGIRYPLHVQKSFYGENAPKISCENQRCIDMIETCQASGLKNELCDHLKSVTADQTLFPEQVLVSDDLIDETRVLKYETFGMGVATEGRWGQCHAPSPYPTPPDSPTAISICEPNKVQKFQFQTSAILLFTNVQKL